MNKKSRILFSILLIAAVVIALIRIISSVQDSENTAYETFLIFGAAGAIIAVIVAIFGIRFKRKEQALPKVRERMPTAYLCSPEMSGQLFVIARDNDEIVLFKTNKKLTEVVRFNHSDIDMQITPLMASAVRNMDGIEITNNSTSEVIARLLVCKDKISLVNMPPLKQPELGIAFEALSRK